MSAQLPLFDGQDLLSPPSNNTPTSRAAAESIADVAPTLREQVYQYIRRQGSSGATIDEVAASLDLLTATVCGRVAELKKAERIHDSGRTRLTRAGRSAAVLCAKGGGHEA